MQNWIDWKLYNNIVRSIANGLHYSFILHSLRMRQFVYGTKTVWCGFPNIARRREKVERRWDELEEQHLQ